MKKSEVIGQLRFPLIVLVTFAHSYGAVADDYSLLASGWNTYEVLKLLVSQTLVKVVVPVFFIISGYLFFANVKTWRLQVYREKLLRRAKTLLFPYLLWNLLMAVKLRTFSWTMFWVYWNPSGVQTDWLGHEQLMTAPANMPLWFLRDLIVVSLLTPLIYHGVKRFGGWLLAVLAVFYLSGVCAFIPGLSAYALFFFTLGAFLAIRQQDLISAMKRHETASYLLSTALAAAMMLTYHHPVFSSLMLCFRLTGAVAVFCLCDRLLTVTPRRLPSVVCRSSYFIYLAHFVFFFSFIDSALFRLLGTTTAALCLHYLLAPLLKAAVFVGLYALWDKIRNLFARVRELLHRRLP